MFGWWVGGGGNGGGGAGVVFVVVFVGFGDGSVDFIWEVWVRAKAKGES